MTPGPSTEQLTVQLALRALDDVLLEMVESGPDSEARLEAQEGLTLAFTQLWRRLPSLHLSCMNDGLWWDDALVLAAEDSRSDLVSTLTAGGIVRLGFIPGAERKDLSRLADILHGKGHVADYDSSDLAMLLFRADLAHISYSVRAVEAEGPVFWALEEPSGTEEEDPIPEPGEPEDLGGDAGEPGEPEGLEGAADPGEPAAEPEVQEPPAPPEASIEAQELQAAIRAEAEEPARPGVVNLEAFDSTLHFLDRDEIRYLQAEVEKQYSRDHTRSMLDLLLDTLELHANDATRTEVIEAIRALLPYLLGTGRFASLAYLGDQLRGILRQVELESEHREALKGILQSVSRQGALTQIFVTLEQEQVDPTAGNLEALVGQLDHRALETVLVWAGQLRRATARDAVSAALETTFRSQPHRLAQLLTSSQRTVVQEALRMAGRLRTEELVEGVTATLDHDDPLIRRQAVEVLGAIPGIPPMRGVARMLRDPESAVRMASYQVFLNRPYRGVTKGLRALMESMDLESLSIPERKLLFSAYGAAAGSEDAPELAELLEGKRSFGQPRPSSETRACAALALARIDHALARRALADARQNADPLVRNAVRIALQGGS